MDFEIDVNTLLNLLKTERKSGEIITLPQDFYRKVDSKAKTYNNESDEYKNILKIENNIKERRTQKMLVYIAYNKELPRPIPSEEEDLYIQIKNILNKDSSDTKPSKMKINKSIPQIVAPSGNKIGPYEQNQIIYIYERSDAKFILENKLGEMID